MPTKLIEAPASTPSQEVHVLAELDAYYAILNDDYAFVAYKETDKSSGEWRVRIKARHLTGVVFEPEMMRPNARPARSGSRSSRGATAWIRPRVTPGASSIGCTCRVASSARSRSSCNCARPMGPLIHRCR